MIEYLQALVLSNCILTVACTHNRHFRSRYELILKQLLDKGKYRSLKKIASRKGGPKPGAPP